MIIRGDATRIPLPDCSVDAVVTDPPAGISFMSRKWDNHGTLVGFQDFLTDAATEMVRVMKPGAHALVWALPRTCHHTGMALERAGLDVRDVVTHLFGSGFPKSHNLDGDWDGWGTALKPAAEFWFLCRRPFPGTVASNVLRWGTGALNIDATRVGYQSDEDQRRVKEWPRPNVPGKFSGWEVKSGEGENGDASFSSAGRWPPNVTMDEEAARLLDEQSGETPRGGQSYKAGVFGFARGQAGQVFGNGKGLPGEDSELPIYGYGDTGGASRFMYVAKASRAERNAGLEGMPMREREGTNGVNRPNLRCRICGRQQVSGSPCVCPVAEWDEVPGRPRQNHHPTVKPLALMRWLVRLVTPPGGLVLDPFLGSGTTLLAAAHEGMRGIGIEREAEYVEIAKGRLSQPIQAGML